MEKPNLGIIIRLSFVILSMAISSSVLAEVLSSNTTADLIEPEDTYESQAPSIINMKIKTVISAGVCEPDSYEGCTLRDVIDDSDGTDDFKPEIKVHMTADNFPDDGLVVNAEMRQRGSFSRTAPQKSFRVKLDSSDDLWRGERRIQLIKGFWDFARIKNKLSYDLMIDIPNLPSMRSQFVNLEVENDETTEDYGLYTQVEYFGKEYLLRRGWDDDSGVYKPENFLFMDRSIFDLDADGKPLDEDAFEERLEIKRGKDHTKLVEMIKAVNDPELDFKTDVFEKYFNQDNYLTWFALNILLGNSDTIQHNFYLYNPKGTENFYFVPWDYDSIGGGYETIEDRKANLRRQSQSVANWWSSNLHKRFLQQPGNFELLQEAVLELKDKHFSRAKIKEKLDSYAGLVIPRATASPDIDYTYIDGNTDAERTVTYNRLYNAVENVVDESYQLFLERLGDPMGFKLNSPILDIDGLLNFTWSVSESLTGAEIKYDLEISSSSAFDESSEIIKINELSDNKYKLRWDNPEGTYYYRVIARDTAAPEVNLQIAGNNLQLENGTTIRGAKAFNVDSLLQATEDNVETPKNTAITIDVLANDFGSGLVLLAPNVWSLKGGNVALVNSRLIYTPKQDFIGEDNIWYDISNSQGGSDFAKVTINVIGTALRPDGVADFAEAEIGETITIDVLANDQGSDLTLREPNAWSLEGGNVSLVNNQLTYTPNASFSGVDKIWYRFYDPQGRSDFGEVSIEVTGTVEVDERPDGSPDFADAMTGQTITIDVLENDMGNDLVLREPNVWSLRGGSVEVVDNQIVYTSDADFTGEDKIWYSFNDPLGRSDYGEVTISVMNDSDIDVVTN